MLEAYVHLVTWIFKNGWIRMSQLIFTLLGKSFAQNKLLAKSAGVSESPPLRMARRLPKKLLFGLRIANMHGSGLRARFTDVLPPGILLR